MPRLKANRITLTLAALALIVGATVAADTGGKLILNGKVASTDVRIIGGSAYVKVSEVAAAMGMHVAKRPDGAYEISADGGANQVEGVHGKVGNTLFTGKWRVTVLSVETPASYTLKAPGDPRDSFTVGFDYATKVVKPNANQTLLLIRCRVVNGQKTPHTLWLAHANSRTALTDTQGESYEPFYDIEGAPIQTKSLLPGAKIDIPILFAVPQGTQIQDLVFTANNNDDTKTAKGNDIRVTLR
jgi:hypothetical protein